MKAINFIYFLESIRPILRGIEGECWRRSSGFSTHIEMDRLRIYASVFGRASSMSDWGASLAVYRKEYKTKKIKMLHEWGNGATPEAALSALIKQVAHVYKAKEGIYVTRDRTITTAGFLERGPVTLSRFASPAQLGDEPGF